MSASLRLRDADLPGLAGAADASSLNAQRTYRIGTAAVLLALIAAAAAGALPSDIGHEEVDWAGVAAALCFVMALVIQGFLAQTRPERAWYEGRAIAESAKSLGWQYAVAGGDYGRGDPGARGRLVHELGALLVDIGPARPFDLPPTASEVSAGMESVRAADLPVRVAAYEAGRIQDQRAWYSEKARWNRRRARLLLGLTLGFELMGATGAVLRASGVVSIDLLGVFSAISAGVVAWSQLKDHVQLDEAYSLASHDLGLIAAEMSAVDSESSWQTFVANAEQAISREHRMWRAARSTQLR